MRELLYRLTLLVQNCRDAFSSLSYQAYSQDT